ncbi:hypothetical protein OO013_02865 [Mangrovivirga sp. M17]|uniref:Uncharacterized protein n=1 Tax=Mangrovivirga halotolerans TaxID=2993936 RepID=A0ABT3RM43_9BACT|nr:hypothetical protein [Mangrovivirga halotolerans]MCX2742789.1 hypothetical protein [Mangrovivirga halotolerans]
MKNKYYFLVASLIMISCLEEEEPKYVNQNRRIISGEFVSGELYLDPQSFNVISGSKFGFHEIDIETGFYNEFSFLHSRNYKISKDGELIYLVSHRDELLLFNKITGKISSLNPPGEKVRTFDLSENEDKVVIENIHGELKQIDLKTGSLLALGPGRNPLFDPSGSQIYINEPSSILNTLTRSLAPIDIKGKIIGKNWDSDELHILVQENVLSDGLVVVRIFDLNVTENIKTKVWEKQFINNGNPDYFIKFHPNSELDKIVVSFKGNNWNFVSTTDWTLNVYLIDLSSNKERKLVVSSNKEIRSYLFDDINGKVYFSLGDPNIDSATLYCADIQ